MPRFLFLFVCLVLQSQLFAKEIAFTFDDSPRHATGYFSGPERADKLIDELKRHNIVQTAFFAVSSKLDTEGALRLKRYANAGHIIANHTHTHPDINRTSLSEYESEILTADRLLSTYPNFRKWFRFPYLREGNTVDKRNGIRGLLQQNGYLNAYITLNNYDWYIENLFQQAIQEGRTVSLNKLKRFYVDVLVEGIEYYDDLAKKHLNRSPKHVLLLHEMDITAMFVGDLADELRARGWSIISPVSAYQDDIAHFKLEKALKFNPGRIGEIAYSKGQKRALWHHTLEEKYLKNRFEHEVLGLSRISEKTK